MLVYQRVHCAISRQMKPPLGDFVPLNCIKYDACKGRPSTFFFLWGDLLHEIHRGLEKTQHVKHE